MNQTASYNSGNLSSKYDRTTQHDWIIPMAVNIGFFILSCWMLVAVIYYGIKTKKWRHIQVSNPDKLNAGLVYSSLLLCTVMCILHYLTSIAYLNIGFYEGEDELCDSISDVEKCCFFLVLFSVQLFLWFRQRAFYSNYMFNVHINKVIKSISFLSIFVIITFGVLTWIFITIPNDNFSSSKGCYFKPNDNSLPTYIFLSVSMVVIGQGVVLALLIHALHQSRMPGSEKTTISCLPCICCKQGINNAAPRSSAVRYAVSRNDSGLNKSNLVTVSTVSKRGGSCARADIMVRRIIKKTLIFAIVAMLVDIMVIVMTYSITNPQEHRELVIVSEDVSAFLNFVFILLSFVQWKDIATSPCRSFEQSKVTTSV